MSMSFSKLSGASLTLRQQIKKDSFWFTTPSQILSTRKSVRRFIQGARGKHALKGCHGLPHHVSTGNFTWVVHALCVCFPACLHAFGVVVGNWCARTRARVCLKVYRLIRTCYGKRQNITNSQDGQGRRLSKTGCKHLRLSCKSSLPSRILWNPRGLDWLPENHPPCVNNESANDGLMWCPALFCAFSLGVATTQTGAQSTLLNAKSGPIKLHPGPVPCQA